MSEAASWRTPAARSFESHPLFGALRLGLRGSQRLGDGLAASWAARVFCTPMPSKLAARRLRPPAGVRLEVLPFEQAGLTLYHWPAPEGARRVLLTHGWGGWALQMAPLAEALAAQGWAVTALDQPAHGRSAGWTSTLAQFARALDYVAARLGTLHGLVGHSMGGSAALTAVARALPVERLVTIASPIDLVQVTRDYAAAFGLSEATRGAMMRRIEASEGVLFERLQGDWTAPRCAVPALVVHDEDDTVVPLTQARQLAALLPRATLVTTRGLGHRRLLKAPSVVAEVVSFLA